MSSQFDTIFFNFLSKCHFWGKFQKNKKMPAIFINRGLQTKSRTFVRLFGAPGGVRMFFTRDARRLLDSLSSKQKVELSSDCLVRLEEFESPTFGSVDQRSIQLSYKRIFYKTKILYAVAFSLSIKK